ncbi:MAG: cytochrome c3 family protein [Candidatus Thiodiazotropha sp.]
MRYFLLLLIPLFIVACGGGNDSSMSIAEPGGLLLNQNHGDGGTAWGLNECDACHAIEIIHQETTPIIRDMVVKKGFSSCMGCHGDNGTSQPRQCLICHNEKDLSGKPYLDGHLSHNFDGSGSTGLSDDDCLVCHTYSDMDGEFELNQDLSPFKNALDQYSSYQSQADFCLSCHNRDHQQVGYEMEGEHYEDPLVALEDAYHHLDYHGWRDGSGEGTYHGLRDGYQYPQLVDCSDCHALHGTTNQKLIIDASYKGAKQLTSSQFQVNSYPIKVSETGDYSQLCAICHEMVSPSDDADVDSGNGLSGVHMVGQDCRPCHTHGEASQTGL